MDIQKPFLPLQSSPSVRSELVDSLLKVLGWMAVPGLAISLLRIPQTGWLPAMTFQVMVVAVLWAIVLLRGRILWQLKFGAILVFWLIQAVYGVMVYGLSGGGLGFLVSLILLVGLILGTKAGVAALLLALAFIGVQMALMAAGYWSFSLDFNAYNRTLTSWTGALIQLGFWTTSVLLVAHRLQGLFQRLNQQLKEEGAKTSDALRDRDRLIGELEEKNRELSGFLRTVTLGLKAPLITVQGFVGYSRQSLEKGDQEGAARDLDRIRGALNKMNELLSDLSTFAESGEVHHTLLDFQMKTAWNEALTALADSLKASGAKVEMPGDFPRLKADWGKVVEIWKQLVENSLKFRHPDRPLVLTAGWRQSPEGSVFFLRDNGQGIPPSYHEQVFRLFEKLDPRTEGSGLGLSQVRRLAENHGGTAWIESNFDQSPGITVCFTLGNNAPHV